MTIKRIVFILVGVAFTGIILALFSLNQLGVFNGERNELFSTTVKQEVSASLDQTNTLNILSTSFPITIQVHKNREMKAVLEGNYRASKNYKPPTLTLKENGANTTLEIDYSNVGLMFYLQQNITLTVYLPESFTGTLEVRTTSGDVTSSYLELEALNIFTTSANIEVTNTRSIGTITAVSTSGSLTLDGISGGSRLQSTSGSIEGTLVDMFAPISIETTSGNVNITQIGNLSYDFELKCTSGKIEVNMPIMITQGANSDNRLKGSLESGGEMLTIQTTSGNIAIDGQK